MATRKAYSEVIQDENYRTDLILKVKGRRGEWIECEGYEDCYILDEDLPKGKYSYYCRHTETNLSHIQSVKKEKGLTVNFWGTIVTDTPINCGENDELLISKVYNIAENGYEVVVVFGEYCAKAYINEGFEGMRNHLDEGSLVRRVFDTRAERDAYIKGIDDADGWLGSAVMDRADVLRHPKVIEKLICE